MGGVTGSGVTETLGGAVSSVSGCYTMVEIADARQYLGAVSGGNEGDFSENYFVSDRLSGINGISYSGRAESISYDELLRVESLPAEFTKLTLRFTVDGEVLNTVEFDYGTTFDETVFPDIPKKEGHYGSWDRTELENLHFDTVVSAVYTPYATALPGSDVRTNNWPIFFVEGQFDEGAVLEAEALPKTPAAFDVVGEDIPDIVKKCFSGTTLYLDVTEQWLLRLPEDGAGSHTVRYLSPDENADWLTVFVKSGGVWREIESEAVGSYLVFTLDGTEAEIAILSTMLIWWVWLIPLALVLILILLIARIVHSIRRKRQPLSQEELQQKAERAEAELARIHAPMERLQSGETPTDAEENGGNPENGSGQSKDEPEE